MKSYWPIRILDIQIIKDLFHLLNNYMWNMIYMIIICYFLIKSLRVHYQDLVLKYIIMYLLTVHLLTTNGVIISYFIPEERTS